MCGIAGILNLENPDPISVDLLSSMGAALRHRGPDESGIYIDDWIGMCHARLSIIDLAGGTQPVHNEDESIWIVFNGEIFNYLELRTELRQQGHQFYTTSDTEVIVHLYEQQGVKCLEKLNGQFAFALWDSRGKKLFLARDRVGILPLHYAVSAGQIFFSSEVKGLFQNSEIPRAIDPLALDEIFTFWTTLPGKTIFRHVFELPAGHFLIVEDGRTSITQYWRIPFSAETDFTSRPVEECAEEALALITDAIRIRLRADVPVGCYLSGGLDSSGITALVKKRFNNHLRTFGIRFEEKAFDEGRFQKGMVSFLDVEHQEVETKNHDIAELFPEVLWNCEKPMLRTAPVPLFVLSKRVRQAGFKVVLTGEGADEVFGGYNIFRETKVRNFWARQKNSNIRPLLIKKLYPYILDGAKGQAFLQRFFGAGLDQIQDPLFSHRIRWNDTKRTKLFFSEDLKRQVGDYCAIDELQCSLPAEFRNWECVAKAQHLEILLFMSNYILSSQGDRVAMAHGVEVRPPYLDHRIIEFAGKIPSRWKIRGLNEKYILKRVYENILPSDILKRPKHPYRAPIREGLLNQKTGVLLEQTYLTQRSVKEAGLFDPNKVQRILNKARMMPTLSEIDNMALAGIVSSQIIYSRFVANFPYKSPTLITPRLSVDRRKINNPALESQ
jgi:asparagine synthase (glutamine-hydrolysing)